MSPLTVPSVRSAPSRSARRELDFATLILLPIVTERHPSLVELGLREPAPVVLDQKQFVSFLRDRDIDKCSSCVPRVCNQLAECNLRPANEITEGAEEKVLLIVRR